jgi:hypothetical protein
LRSYLLIGILPSSFPGWAATIVALNAYTSAEAPSSNAAPFSSGSIQVEYLLAASEFTIVAAGKQITALGFRLDGGSAAAPPSDYSYSSVQIQLSSSLVAMGSLSTTFSDNIGPDAVTVRTGSFPLPASAMTGGAGPNPFYFIPFTTPYTYQGGDLLVTLAVASNQAASCVGVDAVAVGPLADSATSGGKSQYFHIPVMAFPYTAGGGGADHHAAAVR